LVAPPPLERRLEHVLSSFCFLFVVGYTMLGRWSAQALEKRRLRAIARGYVVAKSSPVAGVIKVHPEVAPRVRAVARSLALHRQHNLLVGGCEPIARAATRAARPFLAGRAYKDAMRQHDEGNLAKHDWSRPKVSWADAWSFASNSAGEDPLPASRATYSNLAQQPPSCGSPSVQASSTPLSCGVPQVLTKPPASGEVFSSETWQRIVDDLHHTIMILSAELDDWRCWSVPWCGPFAGPPLASNDVDDLKCQVRLLGAQCDALSGRSADLEDRLSARHLSGVSGRADVFGNFVRRDVVAGSADSSDDGAGPLVAPAVGLSATSRVAPFAIDIKVPTAFLCVAPSDIDEDEMNKQKKLAEVAAIRELLSDPSAINIKVPTASLCAAPSDIDEDEMNKQKVILDEVAANRDVFTESAHRAAQLQELRDHMNSILTALAAVANV